MKKKDDYIIIVIGFQWMMDIVRVRQEIYVIFHDSNQNLIDSS